MVLCTLGIWRHLVPTWQHWPKPMGLMPPNRNKVCLNARYTSELNGRESNPQPLDCESSVLTTLHSMRKRWIPLTVVCQWWSCSIVSRTWYACQSWMVSVSSWWRTADFEAQLRSRWPWFWTNTSFSVVSCLSPRPSSSSISLISYWSVYLWSVEVYLVAIINVHS